jgi:hypothetical protein
LPALLFNTQAMKNKSAFFLLVLACTSIFSCYYDKHVAPEAPVASTSQISYQTDIKPFLTLYCLGQGNQACHVSHSNQGANGDFTTYAGLKAKVDNGSIQSRVLNANGGMPPSYSSGPTHLTAADKQKLLSWVSQGALNN